MALEIRNCAAGRGVFTTATIGKGSLILPFTGPLLRRDQTTDETYAVQIGPDTYIGPSGGMDDLVNHSCSPNAALLIEADTACLVALENIEPGSEILFDYSTVMEEPQWQMPCCCGSPQCRKLIRAGEFLPPAIKQRYRQAGILAWYIP